MGVLAVVVKGWGWGWVRGLGWRAIVAAAVAFLIGLTAGRFSRSTVDATKVEIKKVEAAAGPGADKNLAALKAALANKDKEIQALRERERNIECEGDWERVRGPNGEWIERCKGRAVMAEREKDQSGESSKTPILPRPFSDLPAAPVLARWQFGLGGGVNEAGAIYYGRVGYRVAGPFGGDLIGLYPWGVMAGLNLSK